MARSLRTFFLLFLATLFCVGATPSAAAAAKAADNTTWRIRFLEAAVVEGDTVRLGEVAVPVGEMPPALWGELAARELWPSPPKGKPVNMTRPRLQEAVMQTMRDLAPYCLFPGSMALQRGGAVLTKERIQQQAVNDLTPLLASLAGEGTMSDFRLPNAIFLDHSGQTLVVEPSKSMSAGRLSLRLTVKELDGKAVQKHTGSVFIDNWAEVPCATAPLNKDDVLEPASITFIRMNLAHMRGTPWDGKGGPWRMVRPIGVNQPIYQADLGSIPTVRKGNKVTLLYEGKHILLKVRGETLADGVVGESIPVRNLESKKELYGIVQDASTVSVGGLQQ